MKIEVLFPEFCNLFGDMSNMKYLQQCLPQAEFLYTPFTKEPYFVTETPDLIYLGPMTERTQEKVIQKFRPYAARIRQLIESDVCFLFTGNAMEVLGDIIENEDGSRIDGLKILKLSAKRDMMHRHNSTFLGTWQGMEIMGFKSQFTMAYTQPDYYPLFQVVKGVGMNKKQKTEGIRYHNFFGTYLLGPILILNPGFTKALLQAMGASEAPLAFETEAMEAYRCRLQDFHHKT